MTRRSFLKAALYTSLGISLTGLGGTIYATRLEPYGLAVTRVDVPLRNLARAFAGMKLAQISDLHLGEWMTPQRETAIVQTVNALNPDVVLITGDFVSLVDDAIADELTEMLRGFAAPVYACLGNHDHWTDAPTVSAAVLRAGVQLLRNEHAVIARGNQALYIAGVDDIWERQHDLDAALAGIPQDSAVILLAHEPDYADEVALDGRVGLQLSGHTHGGQVRLPFVGAPLLPRLGQKYSAGLFQVGEMALYVNRGVGMIAPYVRFGCAPEITLLTLQPAAAR
jgi:hypothetical protein